MLSSTGAVSEIESLVSFLSNTNEEVCINAAELIADVKYRNKQNQAEMKEAGAIESLVMLLHNESAKVRCAALHALSSVSIRNEGNQSFIAGMALDRLVELLSDDSPQAQAKAATTLECLAKNNGPNKRLIMKSGALEHLEKLLSSKSALNQAKAADVLTILFNSSWDGKFLRAFGLLHHLGVMLKSKNVRVQASAANALGAMAVGNAELQFHIAKLGVLPLLLTLEFKGDKRTKSIAVRALKRLSEGNVLNDVEIRRLRQFEEEKNTDESNKEIENLAENLEIDAMVIKLAKEMGGDTKAAQAEVALIAAAARNSVNAMLGADGGDEVVRSTFSLGNAEAPSVSHGGAEKVSEPVPLPVVSEQRPVRSQGIGSQGIDRSVLSLSRKIPPLQASAAAELRNIARDNPEMREQIAAKGAIRPLVALLSSANKKCRRNAAGALRFLAKDSEANKVRIGEAGAIKPLVAMLSDTDAGACKAAITALGTLANNRPDNKKRITEEGALTQLEALQKDISVGADVRSAAFYSVMSISLNNPLAKARRASMWKARVSRSTGDVARVESEGPDGPSGS